MYFDEHMLVFMLSIYIYIYIYSGVKIEGHRLCIRLVSVDTTK